MNDTSRLLEWLGHSVVDRSGRALGPVGAIYLDARSDLPKWVLVTGERSRLVPLSGATTRDDRIHVAFDAALVEAAPDLEADDDLGPEEETRLLRHYDVPVGDEGIDLAPPPRPAARGATRLAPAPRAPRRPDPPPPAPQAEPEREAHPVQSEAAAPERRRSRPSLRALVRTGAAANPLGLVLATAGTGFLAGLLREPVQRALRQGLQRAEQASREELAAVQRDGPAPPA